MRCYYYMKAADRAWMALDAKAVRSLTKFELVRKSNRKYAKDVAYLQHHARGLDWTEDAIRKETLNLARALCKRIERLKGL